MAQAPENPQEDRILRLGQLALARGFLKPEQLKEALAEQARGVAAGRKAPRPLQNILLEKKYLTNEQLVELLEEEKRAFQPTLRGKAVPAHPPLGKYEVVRELGRGGMGVVYEAVDTTLGRRVALKMMLANPNADPQEAKMDEERFLREARLCANLPKHPNIVSVHEVGAIEGKRYLAMEFVDGTPMVDWKKAGSISIRQHIALIRDVLLALHHAHEHGLIHRDLKPQNVLVDAKNQPHVVDFGLAKTVGQDVRVSLTSSGMVVGTPIYMSPEQAQGLKTVDRRTDLYAVGVMLYEALTGRPPFTGETAIEILMKAAKNPVPRPSTIVKTKNHPAQDPAIEDVCLKALAKTPRNRYATALAFADDLTKWLKGEAVHVQVAPPTRRKVVEPRTSRRLAYVLGALGAVAAVAFIAVSMSKSALSPAPDGDAGKAVVVEGPPGEEAWKKAVKLLPRIDPGIDALQGTWRLENGALISDGTGSMSPNIFALIEIPYSPPEEYDLKVEFTRLEGKDDVIQLLSKGGKQFRWKMDSHLEHVFGFGMFDGMWESVNPSSVRMAGLENGRRYTCVLSVRNGGVQAFLDGKLITQLKTNYSKVGSDPGLILRHASLLGLATWKSPTKFHAIDVVEVRGKGSFTREPPAPPVNLDLGAGVTMEMVFIRPGAFTMGGTQAPGIVWQADERPEHRVTITKGYYLGKYEVTRGQFAAFVKETGYKTEAERRGKAWGRTAGGQWEELAGNTWLAPAALAQTDSHPVTCITWSDARAFCDWATKKTGREVRLPTEAEWEYACRAGTRTTWSFGDQEPAMGDHGWYDRNSGWTTHPVGLKRANAWGLYDMHGNVWEWCQDWAGPFAGDASDPAGPAGGTRRCLRGGSWGRPATDGRSAFRHHEDPSHPSTHLGFRVAAGSGRAAVTAPSRPSHVPPDAREFAGRYYKLFPEKLGWHAAKKRCEGMKGHLVTIGSSEENAVVQSLAAGQSTWIGITDEGHEGRWEWITGEPVQFSDWSPGEPNSLGGTEHWGCLNSERGLKWNDFGTTFSAAFVCEWEPADAALPVLTLPLGAGVTMDTVYIRPGNFVMGGTEAPRYSSQRDERPAHTVTITKGFHIGKFEVTRAQFEAFAKATGYKTEAERAGKTTGVANGAVVSIPGAHWADLVSYKQANDHPVTCVSWNDAKAFCDWMSAATGRVVSLPTEAEWEHAHRAGSRTRWHFGDNEPATGEYAWYNGNSDWRTHPVGAKKPNAWGLFDTHGNVSEWCQDWAGPYGGDAQDPSGPPAGEFRIMRGGSLYNAPLDMVSAFRDAQPPSGHANNTGFRVVVR